MKNYYLAYGSNLNLPQMAKRCPSSHPVGTAVLEGYELLFKGSAARGFYLTIEPKQGAQTPAAVWEIAPQDLPALDRYEGFPSLYYKKDLQLPVALLDTGELRTCSAFVYVMHEGKALGAPTKSYLKTCMEGYRAFGFETRYLFAALERSGAPLPEGASTAG